MSNEERHIRLPKSYFIIISTNLDSMYYCGLVYKKENDQYTMTNDWTNRREFATQFGKYELAARVAQTFAISHASVGFSVVEDVETYGTI